MRQRAKPVRFTPFMLNFMRENATKMSAQEVADEFGVDARVVKNRAFREGIAFQKSGPNHHKSKYDSEDIRLARLLIDDGELELKEIDEKLGFSKGHSSKIKNGNIHKSKPASQ